MDNFLYAYRYNLMVGFFKIGSKCIYNNEEKIGGTVLDNYFCQITFLDFQGKLLLWREAKTKQTGKQIPSQVS